MHRLQLIEFHEQPWFPVFLRNEITDTLQCGLNLSGAYASIVPLLQRAFRFTGTASIVDLCSGAGGPWLNLARKLKAETGSGFHISLTDKYPNAAAFDNAHDCPGIPITFYKYPVDARDIPSELDGFRTLFTSFHHFRPDEARAIIQNAVDARQGIGIFEITRRAPSAIMLILLWSVMAFLLAPFVHPFRWSRLLFTYVVPIIPLVLLFDGVVSCLRTYRPRELRELVGKPNETEYQWQAGEFRGSWLRLPITYLIEITPENLRISFRAARTCIGNGVCWPCWGANSDADLRFVGRGGKRRKLGNAAAMARDSPICVLKLINKRSRGLLPEFIA